MDEPVNNDLGEESPEVIETNFDADLIRKYPKSNRRISIDVTHYGIGPESLDKSDITTSHISPYGLEFKCTEEYTEGALLKIHVTLPDYWQRKQQFVEYSRVDTPTKFKMLAKVVSTEKIGKKGKKNMVLCRTVNMDQVDEEVLKSFLQEG
ncbi:MAG: hypothetical protein HQK54_05040 [Oligoflexales bacterium]|nr:hypothetical protein [Oligoflexales bacterium]